MGTQPRRFRVFGRRHLVWLVPLMLGFWALLAFAGVDRDVAFLAAMSAVPIGVTAYAYSDGGNDRRYWITLAGYGLVHVLALRLAGDDWIPSPAVALVPLFLLDYVLLAYLFPMLSGLEYDYSDRPL